MDSNLTQLRKAMEKLILQMAQKITASTEQQTEKQQVIFLVNAYDTITTSFAGNNVPDNIDRKQFQQLLNEQVSRYADLELNECFAKLLTFVKQSEPLVNKAIAHTANRSRANTVEMEAAAKDFDKNWKDGLAHIHANLTRNFPNLRTGMYIMRISCTKLLEAYSRYSAIVYACYPNPPFRANMISDQKLFFEIKRYLKDFSSE